MNILDRIRFAFRVLFGRPVVYLVYEGNDGTGVYSVFATAAKAKAERDRRAKEWPTTEIEAHLIGCTDVMLPYEHAQFVYSDT